MKLGIFSDLHLEFSDWNYSPNPDVFYINAGDTHPYMEHRLAMVDRFAPNYFSIRGNHDFYGSSFPEMGHGQHKIVLSNGMTVAGATLWTLLDEVEWFYYRQGLVDSHHIANLTYERYKNAHANDLLFLLGSKADIIVSHHSPSMQSCWSKWGNSVMNKCFHNDLDSAIKKMEHPPKYWIHGHTHDASHYTIGKTTVICHPRGYPNEANHAGYKPFYIDV